MILLLTLTALATLGIVGSIVLVARDGYRQVPRHHASTLET